MYKAVKIIFNRKYDTHFFTTPKFAYLKDDLFY